MQLDHVALWTPDLERARAFYTTYFAATHGPCFEDPRFGFRSYFLSFPGGSRLELMQMPGIAPRTTPPDIQVMGLVHLAFAPGDAAAVEALVQRVRADGGRVLEDPHDTPDGYYEGTVLDPDGNRIEIVAARRA